MSVWFITGASRGFGAEIVEKALEGGHQVVATARNPQSITERFPGAGEALAAVAVDVTDEAQIAAAVEAGLSRFGRIDVVVNNAGRGLLGAVEEASDAGRPRRLRRQRVRQPQRDPRLCWYTAQPKVGTHHQPVVHRWFHQLGRMGHLLVHEIRRRGLLRSTAPRGRAPGHPRDNR